MLPLLVPVFAQLVTLGVRDRTEGRYLHSEDKRYEASSRPGADLTLSWPRYRLAFGYAPSLLLTPLERAPRELVVYHNLLLSTAYNYKHTALTLGSNFSFGSVNFIVAGLQDAGATAGNNGKPMTTAPTTGTAEPAQPGQQGQPTQPSGTGTPVTPVNAQPVPLQTSAQYRTVRYESWSTSASLSHQATRELSLSAFATYVLAGALRKADRVDYPRTHGTAVGGAASYTFSWTARDGFVSNLNAQEAISSQAGNRATAVIGRETWNHVYSKHASSSLGAGLSITRNSRADGLIAYSVYPNFAAGVSYQDRLARGNFGLGAFAYSAPALDPLRATVDPRIGIGATVSWSRKRFSSSLAGSAAISTAPAGNNAGAFDSYQGSFSMGYRFTDWLSADGGARASNQVYQGTTLVPLSYSVFAGLTFGYDMVLLHSR